MAKAPLLPHLPMKFKDAVAAFLKVKPEPQLKLKAAEKKKAKRKKA